MFCVDLRTNSDLCHLQHKLIGFYNRDEMCLQRGTDWVFKYNSGSVHKIQDDRHYALIKIEILDLMLGGGYKECFYSRI